MSVNTTKPIDDVQTGDRSLRRAEIKLSYLPKLVGSFLNRRRMTATLERLHDLEIRFGPNDVSRLSAVSLGNDDMSSLQLEDTSFSMVVEDSHDDRAMHDALRRFFVWVGNIPSDDIITWSSPSGNIQQQLIVRRKTCRGWLQKLTAEDGISPIRTMPISSPQNCTICRDSAPLYAL